MLGRILGYAGVALLWLLHWLPLPALAACGCALGDAFRLFGRHRRHIVETNLALCFPGLDAAARQRLCREHFRALGQSLLERGVFWWGSVARLDRMIRVEGEAIPRDLLAAGRPVILLVPHFIGLDAAGVAMTRRHDTVSIYSRQKNPVFDRLLLAGRKRFGDQKLLARQDGALSTIKAMKAGRPFFYLPDMDFGRRDSVFVPFFGVQAATIPGLSRLARAAGAAVVPCLARRLPGAAGYRIELGEPWAEFPTEDPVVDTLRMNRWLEQAILSMPEQYYWVHRRFKTRPPGEARFY